MAAKRPLRPALLSRRAETLAVVAIIIGVFAIILSIFALYSSLYLPRQQQSQSNPSQFGSTIAGIDTPLNASELAVINNASDSYFETAGLMYLNGTLTDEILNSQINVTPYVVNGKLSVVYLGSITCIFCGENRWSMALALGRFGTFSQLYNGYSSFSDDDVPTLYWNATNYTTSDVSTYNPNGLAIGNHYGSDYINFYSIEGSGNIQQGFFLQPLSVMMQEVNETGNQSYINVFDYISSLQTSNSTSFRGTPYTIWGTSVVLGADAVVFGNTLPSNSTLPLTYETHVQVLRQLKTPSDQFAWGEYAGADVYIAHICKALNNTAPICSLSAIQILEAES